MNNKFNIDDTTQITDAQYTLDDLRNKYVRVGTPEYEVFMDACEGLGITWPSGNKPREEGIDDDFVSFDSLDGNLGNCDEDFYIYDQEYSQFITKTNVVDIAEEAPWTIYNNTLPMSELTDEQAVELFLAGRSGANMEYCSRGIWLDKSTLTFNNFTTYRVKSKSEMDMSVDKMLTFYKYDIVGDKVIDMLKEAYDNGCRFV